MFGLSKEQEKKLIEIVPNAEDLAKKDDINGILDVLYFAILDTFDEDDEPTRKSAELQKIYDMVYLSEQTL